MADARRRSVRGPLARLVRALPVPPPGVLQRAARAYAGLSARAGVPPFRDARDWPDRLGALLGEPLSSDLRRRVVAEVFALKLLNWMDAYRPAGVAVPAQALDATGREHLARALGRGRGVVLVTGHYGFPPAVRVLLGAAGVPWVALRPGCGRSERATAVTIGTTAWSRAGALRAAGRTLRENHACIVLADGGAGVTVRVPFLADSLLVSLGAFALARSAGCPVLPFFAYAGPRGRFRVAVGAALDSGRPGEAGEPADLARAFAAAYAAAVRTDPAQLWWRACD